MNKEKNRARKIIQKLSDTELFLAQTEVMVEIVNKIPLAIKMNMLGDEMVAVELLNEEIKKRLSKPTGSKRERYMSAKEEKTHKK